MLCCTCQCPGKVFGKVYTRWVSAVAGGESSRSHMLETSGLRGLTPRTLHVDQQSRLTRLSSPHPRPSPRNENGLPNPHNSSVGSQEAPASAPQQPAKAPGHLSKREQRLRPSPPAVRSKRRTRSGLNRSAQRLRDDNERHRIMSPLSSASRRVLLRDDRPERCISAGKHPRTLW